MANFGASQLNSSVRPTMGSIMKARPIVGVAVMALLTEASALAKIAPATLADVVERAEFIGIVRVDRVSRGIPLLVRRRATATILESWKGQREGTVTFIAQPTWTCDISDAKRGEEAVVFISGDELVLAGRGRMPIFTRGTSRLATIWPDVRLPPDIETGHGPDPQYDFIRSVLVDDLAAAVAHAATASSAVE